MLKNTKVNLFVTDLIFISKKVIINKIDYNIDNNKVNKVKFEERFVKTKNIVRQDCFTIFEFIDKSECQIEFCYL